MKTLNERQKAYLSSQLAAIANEYTKALCEMYECDWNDSFWVADEVGTSVYYFGDYYLNMGQIKELVEKDVPFETFNSWYWYHVDAEIDYDINLHSWIMGLRPELLEVNNKPKEESRTPQMIEEAQLMLDAIIG
jgi:hypothetical protein